MQTERRPYVEQLKTKRAEKAREDLQVHREALRVEAAHEGPGPAEVHPHLERRGEEPPELARGRVDVQREVRVHAQAAAGAEVPATRGKGR